MLIRVCIKCGEIFGCRDENGDILCTDCEFRKECTYQKEFSSPEEVAAFATLGFCPKCLKELRDEKEKWK